MPLLIDSAAKEIALRRWALPECLHVPIAAVDEASIRDYVGDVEQVLAGGAPPMALLIGIADPPTIDPLLPIGDHANAGVFHARRQVWVHIAFSRYRDAYRKAFPDEAIGGKVLSHAMNRRTAALKGFSYVRITPVSRGANSSSGFSEKWGVSLHASAERKSPARHAPALHSICRFVGLDADARRQTWRRRHGDRQRRPEAGAAQNRRAVNAALRGLCH